MLWLKLFLAFPVLCSLALALEIEDPYLQIYPAVNETDGRTPLYFALVLSFGGGYKSIGALPGVQIALDYINSEPSILPGYSLHYTLTDSQVNSLDSYMGTESNAYTEALSVGERLASERKSNESNAEWKAMHEN